MNTKISTVRFPDLYPVEYARIWETPKGYRIILQGRRHPERLTNPGRESMWVRKTPDRFPSHDHAAKWALHTAAGKRIRTRWEGLCLVTKWRSAGIDPEISKRVGTVGRERYGFGAIYTSEEAQAYFRKLLNQIPA